MAIDIGNFRAVVNKHDKLDEMNPAEKLDVIESSTGTYAYLKECIADGDPENFKGLNEYSDGSGEWIYPSESTYSINYESAVIAFSSSYTIPLTLYAFYWGGGSVIWADDVTDLQKACNTIHDNTLYKDGSVALTGNLNVNSKNLSNVNLINGVNVNTHKHTGLDGTVQLDDSSISALSMSKVTGLTSELNSKQSKLPVYQSGKFLTNNGSVLSWGAPYTRNIGEIVQSIIPLTDSKLHLLDGSVLDGTSTYKELYDYIAAGTLQNTYASGVKVTGNLSNVGNILSGFSSTAYADIPVAFAPSTQSWEVQIRLNISNTAYQSCLIKSTTERSLDFHHSIYFDATGIYQTEGDDYFATTFYININCQRYNKQYNQNYTATSTAYIYPNQDYILKYGYSNSTLYIQGKSADSSEFITLLSRSIPDLNFYAFTESALRLGCDTSGVLTPFIGSINLNDCYLKVNDVIIWSGGTQYTALESPILVDENIWQNNNTYFGVCGKFVLNTNNKTVRIPNIVGMLEGTSSSPELGIITPAGLPNIEGRTYGEGGGTKEYPYTGAFWQPNASTQYPRGFGADGTDTDNRWVLFDASRYNPIYGNSDTVQPQTLQVLNYMVVAK